LDGPLLDVSEKYYRVYVDLLEGRGALPVSKEEYWESKRHCVPDETILGLSGIKGCFDEYRNLFRARIESTDYASYDTVWPGIAPMLQRLGQHVGLVLVTLRRSREILIWELEKLKLHKMFAYVLSSAGSGSSSERAAIKVALTNQVLSARNASTWFVGDTETDILAGQRLGSRTVAVTFGIRSAERLTPLKPDRTVDTPNELVRWSETCLD